MFRSTFRHTRYIVPVSGYYEWRAAEGGKQPYFISWLTGKTVIELLRPAPNDLLRMWLVSKRVNVSGR